MNDERAVIINSAIEGRLSPGDASALLDALLRLEGDEAVIVEPPCRPPPWRVNADLTSLLLAKDAALLLPNATYQIARGLARLFSADDLGQACVAFSALEVMSLADFWAHGQGTGFTYGSMALIRRGGAWHQEWVTIAIGVDSFAFWLFSHPFPVAPTPAAKMVDEQGRQVTLAALPEPGPVVTPLGAFGDCLRVVRRIADEREGATRAETLTVWLAPGIGPVRLRRERVDGSDRDIVLTAHAGPAGEDFFPRVPGFWWRFDTCDGDAIRQELWRVLACPEDGACWLSTSVYAGRLGATGA